MLTREDRRQWARRRRAGGRPRRPAAGGGLGTLRRLVLLGAVCLGGGLYVVQPRLVERAALPVEDLKLSLRRAVGAEPRPDPRLVVVAVDEPSVRRLGPWPWRRSLLGALLGRLREAELVGLDVVFPGTTEPREDEGLARAVADGGNVVLGYLLRQLAGGAPPEPPPVLEAYAYRAPALQTPVVGLREFDDAQADAPPIASAGLSGGFLNVEADPDGLHRTYPLAYLYGGRPLPPLAVQLVQYHLDRPAEVVLDPGGVRAFSLGAVRTRGARELRLNFGDPAAVATVSAAAVLDGRAAPSSFRGKIVLIGVTAAGAREVRPTPVDLTGPRVYLHATAASNLLRNRLLRTAAPLDFALLFLSCLAAAAGSGGSSRCRRLGAYALAAGGAYAVSLYCLVAHDVWLREFYFLAPALLVAGILEGAVSSRARTKADRLREAFSSCVSAEVLEELVAAPAELDSEGALREVTVLCAELPALGGGVERASPPELLRALRLAEERMAGAALENRGFVARGLAPGVTVLFNAPHDVPDHPDCACRAALDLVRRLREGEDAPAAGGVPRLAVAVGIGSGACVVGNTAPAGSFRYAAAGRAVDLAPRLAGLCEVYGVSVLVSEATKERLMGPFVVRRLDRLRVEGRRLPSSIFEVSEESERAREVALRFQEALELYFQRQFYAAATLFSELSAAHGDPPSALFAERCALFGRKPPSREWDGVFPPAE